MPHSIKSPHRRARPTQAGSEERIAGRGDDFMTRRAAILEQERRDAERWLDDGDAPGTLAVALPPPEIYR